jgi:hypothetical protein
MLCWHVTAAVHRWFCEPIDGVIQVNAGNIAVTEEDVQVGRNNVGIIKVDLYPYAKVEIIHVNGVDRSTECSLHIQRVFEQPFWP